MIVELSLFLSLMACSWIIAFLVFNDLKVPSHSIKHIKNALVIFPHPDDEVLGTGGIIHKLCKQGCMTTVVILTKGEKGISGSAYAEELKQIRVIEAKRVKEILGTTTLIHEDFGDENLIFKKKKIKKYTDNLLKTIQPDLVITYDLSGLYGHKDHMAVSEVVTSLVIERYQNIPLWYVSFPSKILDRIKIPPHRKGNQLFVHKRSIPTHKIFIGLTLLRKIFALSAYRSQRETFQNAMPIRIIPFELFYSVHLFEYFSIKN
jgi:LmbE family N-acetylglucosaminyl deacetylase